MAAEVGILDIEDLIDNLMRQRVTPENLIGWVTRELFQMEGFFAVTSQSRHRNSAHACVAYARMLYDFGQIMFSARS